MKKIVYFLPPLLVFVNAYLSQNLSLEWFKNNESSVFNILCVISILSSTHLIYMNHNTKGNKFWYIFAILVILFSVIGIYFNSLSIGF